MTKKELKERWNSGEWFYTRDRILDSIRNRQPLEECGGLSSHNGKIDLRGISFPKPSFIPRHMAAFIPKFSIAGYAFDNVDLSLSDLSQTLWKNSSLRDCVFESANLSHVKFRDCQIYNSSFSGSNFWHADLGIRNKKDVNLFNGVSFSGCNFSQVNFYYPRIENCVFKDCRYTSTDFGGSRFTDCIFSGEIHNAWFRGFCRRPEKVSFLDKYLFRGWRPDAPNKMVNVDFSGSTFGAVFFSHSIDLSTCVLPAQDNYLKVSNPGKVFRKVREIIDKEWESPYKERAVSAIEKILHPKEKGNMGIDFIYTDFQYLNAPEDFSKRLYQLIKDVNRALNRDAIVNTAK